MSGQIVGQVFIRAVSFFFLITIDFPNEVRIIYGKFCKEKNAAKKSSLYFPGYSWFYGLCSPAPLAVKSSSVLASLVMFS